MLSLSAEMLQGKKFENFLDSTNKKLINFAQMLTAPSSPIWLIVICDGEKKTDKTSAVEMQGSGFSVKKVHSALVR